MTIDSGKLELDKRRGIEANQVLENPIFKESFMLIRADIVDKFTNTKFNQKDERDELWRKMQTLDAIEKHLTRVLQTGTLAEQTLGKKLRNIVDGRKRSI